MRIRPTDDKAWLELSRNGSEAHASFSIECSVDIGHGKFRAKNSDVHFLNAEEFVKTLDAFVLNRKVTPQLNGTYDTSVKFFRPQGKNLIMLSFVIGDAFSGYAATTHYKTEGEFEVNAEYLDELIKNFNELLKPA